jgi:hypothetical protein
VTIHLFSLQIKYEPLWEPYLFMKWFFSNLGRETTFLIRRLHSRKADTTGFADVELETVEGQAIALSIKMRQWR